MRPVTHSHAGLRPHRGFTLVELAIVLIIVTLLTSGLMMTLSAQHEASARADTQRRLDEAREALLGYAAANGRLPCPAASGGAGVESPSGGGTCTNSWDGFLPGITLGITNIDESGYAIDAWGNRIRYALTTFANATYCSSGYCFATADGVKSVWNNVSPSALKPDLTVCSTSTGMTGSGSSAACATNTALVKDAVAVIHSRGKNGALTPTSSDELANNDADPLFVSHTPTPDGTNEFDDLVTWISPNLLYSRLIAAGRLP